MKHMDQHNNQCSDSKVRLMISSGGTLQRRDHDNKLLYIDGDTKILVLNRKMKFLDIVVKTNSLCNLNTPYELRYLVPGQKDLDTLVTVASDEDVDNMMDEYDSIHPSITTKMRLYVVHPKTQCVPLLVMSSDSLTPDYLFGFDKEYDPNASPDNFEVPEFPDQRDLGLHQENQKEKQVEEKKQLTEQETHGISVYQTRFVAYGGMQRLGGGVMGNWEHPVHISVQVNINSTHGTCRCR